METHAEERLELARPRQVADMTLATLKRLLICLLGSFLIAFSSGYLWRYFLFPIQYQRLGVPDMRYLVPLGATSLLVESALISWMYPRLFRTTPNEWIRSAIDFATFYLLMNWSLSLLPIAIVMRPRLTAEYLLYETCLAFLQCLLMAPFVARVWRGHARGD